MEKLGRLRYYLVSLVLTVGILVAIGVTHPLEVLLVTLMLVALEVSFSFDNAVVNALVLARMSHFWQLMFLSVGIIIAVGVVRFVLPIAIVMATAGMGFGQVIDLALRQPLVYAAELEAAHTQVAVIGGVFLLMIFLQFIFEEREQVWIAPLERPLARFGWNVWVSAGIASVIIVAIGALEHFDTSVFVCGFGSLAVFLFMHWLDSRLLNEDVEELITDGNADSNTGSGVTKPVATGRAAAGLFMYLEFQDAAFSLDGVSGAFAISSDVVVIAAGLGIGALFVRAMTVDLVRTGTLAEFRYLEHGAHWAIGTLAACILVSPFVEIPDVFTGSVGIVFITIAVLHSVRENRRDARAAALEHIERTDPDT